MLVAHRQRLAFCGTTVSVGGGGGDRLGFGDCRRTAPVRLRPRRIPRRSSPAPLVMREGADRRRRAATRTATAQWRNLYVRPSAAIERGGGFYVPGLEGGRLRILVGALIGALLALNHAVGGGGGGRGIVVDGPAMRALLALRISESVAACAVVALLALGVVEEAEEQQRRRRAAAGDAAARLPRGASPSGGTGVPLATDENAPDDAATRGDGDGRSAAHAYEDAARFVCESFLTLTPTAASAVVLRGGRVIAHASSALELDGDARAADSAVAAASRERERRLAADDAGRADETGEAVRRVLDAGRGVYIDDTDEVPSSVTFPFLARRPASVLIEIGDGGGAEGAVGHLSSSSESSESSPESKRAVFVAAGNCKRAFTAVDRRWARALARRFAFMPPATSRSGAPDA